MSNGSFSEDVDRLFAASDIREGGVPGSSGDLDWSTLDESVWRTLKRDVDRNMEIEIDLGGGSTTISLPALDEEALPPEEAYKAEVREILDDSMAELPENYREVILLRDYAGASWDYVARERGTSVPAAEQLYRRAWIRLRRIARPRLDAAQPPSEG